MATVQELLQERVATLRELMDQIDEEISGDPDLARLSELADQLGAQSDEFASTVSEAQGILAGSDDGEEQAGEERQAEVGGGPAGEERQASSEGGADEGTGETDEGDGEES